MVDMGSPAPWKYGICATAKVYLCDGQAVARLGEHSGVIAGPSADHAVVIQAAFDYVQGLGGGCVALVPSGGTFTCTAALTARNNVDVYGCGCDIIVDTPSTVNGVNFASVTNAIWRDVTVRRRDTTPITAAVHASYFSGTCDDTLRLFGCRFLNEVTATINSCHGIFTGGSSSPSFSGCTITGGGGGTSCFGIYTGGSSSPSFSGCTITGGGGGTSCHGIFTGDSSSPSFSGCTITGGGGGTSCLGIITDSSSSPSFAECTITGGGGGTSCFGIITGGSSSPSFSGCTITGGGGGTYCYGIFTDSSSSPSFAECTAVGGAKSNYWWTYTSADNGRFQPYAVHPYILVGAYVQVTSAAAGGTTLDLGTSIGGNEIAAGIPIDSTGAKYFAITNVEVAAAGYMYATPSAGIAEGSLSVRYVVMTNYGTCYALYMDTVGIARFANGFLLANGASDAFYVTDVAEAADAWRLTNSHAETLDPTNQRSIISQSAYDPCPIYNCFLRGLVVNAVPPAGTAVGSNVQE